MRAAVISDIHANLSALEAVLGAIDKAAVDELWCLGDVVGYGARPDECTSLVRERCDTCLVGNHDLAALGALDVRAFSETAAAAVRWTVENSAPETLEFLGGLEAEAIRDDTAMFHASPRDPIWEYVLSEEQAAECMQVQPRRVSLIGHSHVALFFVGWEETGRQQVRGSQAGDGTRLEVGSGAWILNPGSVGQPRDGDPRAAWMELDLEAWTVQFHREKYDIDLAAQRIAAAGLPQHLADRLYAGQ